MGMDTKAIETGVQRVIATNVSPKRRQHPARRKRELREAPKALLHRAEQMPDRWKLEPDKWKGELHL